MKWVVLNKKQLNTDETLPDTIAVRFFFFFVTEDLLYYGYIYTPNVYIFKQNASFSNHKNVYTSKLRTKIISLPRIFELVFQLILKYSIKSIGFGKKILM